MPATEPKPSLLIEQQNVVKIVYEVLEENAPRAYCVDDFFRNAGPGGPDQHGLLSAFKRAVLWQMSRTRSKLLVKTALETLVFLGEVEKRSLPHRGEPVLYYRLKPVVNAN